MDILEAVKKVSNLSCEEITKGISNIDEECAALIEDIINYCARNELDNAKDCLVQYDNFSKMRRMLVDLRAQALFNDK